MRPPLARRTLKVGLAGASSRAPRPQSPQLDLTEEGWGQNGVDGASEDSSALKTRLPSLTHRPD